MNMVNVNVQYRKHSLCYVVCEVSKDWRNLFFYQRTSGMNIKVVLNKIFFAPLHKCL